MNRRWIAVGACLLISAVSAQAGYSIAMKQSNRAGTPVSSVVAAEDADPLTRFRTEREQLRARQTAQLNDIIHGETDQATVVQAQQQLLSLIHRSEQEMNLEGILSARGFDDVLVTVSDSAVNVLLRSEAVTQRQSAVILDLIMRETGISSGNVKIIPVN